MRERIKRRKKPAETSGTESSKPIPLQPDYYEVPTVVSGHADEPEKNIEASPVAPMPDTPAEAGTETEASSVEPQRRRRRRSRGGRGRGTARTRRTVANAQGAEPVETAPAVEQPSSAPVPVTAEARLPIVAEVPAKRPVKGVVVLAIGLPGSGKSSWFKRHQINPLSSDLLRALLFDDAQEQRFQDLVFSNLRSMLKARLIARRPMNYVDATNLTPHERHNWIKLAKDYGYEVHAVFFDVPLEVCLERNRRRQRIVDEAVMQRMSSKLRAPTFDEGFSKITVVRVKKKEGEAAVVEAV